RWRAAAVAGTAALPALAATAARGLGAFRHLPLRTDRLQADLALRVDVFDQHGEVVALADRLLDAGQALTLAELRDVHEAVAAGDEVHERAERRRLHDAALVGLPHQDRPRVRDLVDHAGGLVGALAAAGPDEHGPVVLDVDLGAGHRDDLVDLLPLRADHLAD